MSLQMGIFLSAILFVERSVLQLFASMDHGRSVGMIQLALGGCDPEDSTHDESKRSFVGPHSDGFAW